MKRGSGGGSVDGGGSGSCWEGAGEKRFQAGGGEAGWWLKNAPGAPDASGPPCTLNFLPWSAAAAVPAGIGPPPAVAPPTPAAEGSKAVETVTITVDCTAGGAGTVKDAAGGAVTVTAAATRAAGSTTGLGSGEPAGDALRSGGLREGGGALSREAHGSQAAAGVATDESPAAGCAADVVASNAAVPTCALTDGLAATAATATAAGAGADAGTGVGACAAAGFGRTTTVGLAAAAAKLIAGATALPAAPPNKPVSALSLALLLSCGCGSTRDPPPTPPLVFTASTPPAVASVSATGGGTDVGPKLADGRMRNCDVMNV